MSAMTGTVMEDVGDEDSLAEGLTIDGRFVICRKLGGGGMGEVYLAENRNVRHKYYAIKILRPEYSNQPRFVEMLHDEATKQARLEHPNVVGMYDYFSWAGRCCLLQTYVEGSTLAQMLDTQRGGLGLGAAMDLMVGVLRGLDFAHAAGILHCDVKPANVIVDGEGQPHVTDFGISRDIAADSDNTGLAGAGTAEYMSPEQALPPYRIDHRSDVFSAGVMFFEILCGHLPFERDPKDSSPQRSRESPDVREFREDIPEPIARIVATALQRDPEQRFQSCGAFAQAILDYRRRVEIRKILRWALPLAAGCLVALGIGLYEWKEHAAARARAREAEASVQLVKNQAEAATLAQSQQVSIRQSVHIASAALDQLCQISAEYEIKKGGVETAMQSGLGDMALKFKEKLNAMKQSIDRQAAAYRDAVTKLSRDDASQVSQGIEQDKQAELLVQVFAPAIIADDAALRAGRTLPPLAQMQGRCPATTR